MSDFSNKTYIATQRTKNQITLPSGIIKKTKARAGTKYLVSVNKNGDIELKILKNDIRKYIGLLKTNQSAVQIISQERQKDDESSFKTTR